MLSDETSITVDEDLLEDAEFCKLLFLIFGVIFRVRREVLFPAGPGFDEALSDSSSTSSSEMIQNQRHYLNVLIPLLLLTVFPKRVKIIKLTFFCFLIL